MFPLADFLIRVLQEKSPECGDDGHLDGYSSGSPRMSAAAAFSHFPEKEPRPLSAEDVIVDMPNESLCSSQDTSMAVDHKKFVVVARLLDWDISSEVCLLCLLLRLWASLLMSSPPRPTCLLTQKSDSDSLLIILFNPDTHIGDSVLDPDSTEVEQLNKNVFN